MKVPALFLAPLALSLFLAPAGAQAMMAAPPRAADPSAMMAPPDAASPSLPGGGNLRTAPSTGIKLQFTDLAAAQALAERQPVVLFFAADWCPTCRAALRDINANGSRLGRTALIVVDYDRSAELKRRYGVSLQHTFVQIDGQGRKLAAWNGGGVEGILRNLVALK